MKNTTNYDGLSIDDIIFDGRNKAYGAYELRQSYNRRIKQGVLGALALSALLCSYQSLMALYHPVHALEHKQVVAELKKVSVEKIETIEMAKPKTPELPKPKSVPAPKGVSDPPTVRSTAILIPTNTEHATDSIPHNDMLAITATGDQNKNGTTPGDKKGDPNGDIATTVARAAQPATETVDWASVMPEYPGGEPAMMRQITSQIDYPDDAKALDIQGRVVVGFIVDENGNVGDVRVVRGLNRSLDEESIRVVRKLQRFKPGSQGGKPVRVRFTLPIMYRLS
ncbi:MAG: energy transducer TonB [Bacteroidetes bacterium]|nr:energy transducer TonB [Bacteroidota bacterium]